MGPRRPEDSMIEGTTELGAGVCGRGDPSKMLAFGLLLVLECTIVAGYTFVIRGEEEHLQAWDTVGGRSTLQHTFEFL